MNNAFDVLINSWEQMIARTAEEDTPYYTYPINYAGYSFNILAVTPDVDIAKQTFIHASKSIFTKIGLYLEASEEDKVEVDSFLQTLASCIKAENRENHHKNIH